VNGPTLDDTRPRRAADNPQARASDPASSAWVTASAGSGKTHVLVQRILRLLLDGAAPSRILCLTFTRTAAANMAGRVFRELARWTALDDDALAETIIAAGAPAPDPARLAFARRLFARAIETPGGLKIETIHSFCGRLLRMFPFEANVPAGFRVADERESRQLILEARAEALASVGPHGRAVAALGLLAREIGRERLEGLIGKALAWRAMISEAIVYWGDVETYEEALARRLGLAPTDSVASIEQVILAGLGDSQRRSRIAAQLDEGSANDRRLASSLRAVDGAATSTSAVENYLSVFFTEDNVRQTLVTKGLAKRRPNLDSTLRAEQDRLVGLREKLYAARTVARSAALIDIAVRTLGAYKRLKTARGLLDFDDLIERTTGLLTRADAAWVLFKLDSGIDHILVDEAQDTSREQWEILEKLAEEFTAGKGARDRLRTFFAVGDDKQSIFSFQGAAPEMFAAMRTLLQRRHRAADMPFAVAPLTLSYRSARTILDCVDAVFAKEAAWRGLTADDEPPLPHSAFRDKLPGRVEVWPLIAGEGEPSPSDWRLPLDTPSSRDPPVVLALRIAAAIAGWLKADSPERVHGRGHSSPRPIRPGDVLILVRSRNAFFEAMIRALKNAGVKTFGADRLALKNHIAAMDLAAAGAAALCVDDDLSLAVTLKSPLFGFDDEDLIRLAPGRKGALAEALAARPEEKYRDAWRRLEAWSQRARTHSPYDFYARLLGEEGGRRAMLGRLGPEAGDAIDEFLSQALSFERRRAPSLAAFLHEIEETDVTVRRDMEESADSVRVMTVHAAKGLEAPVVFLPDTCGGPDGGPAETPLFALAASSPNEPAFLAWSPRGAEDAAAVAEAREARRRAMRGEHRRLLYVAMTRASERLVVAGYHGIRAKTPGCWYEMIEQGLVGLVRAAPAPWGAAETIWRMGEDLKTTAGTLQGVNAGEPPAPAWFEKAAPRPPQSAILTAASASSLARADDGRRALRLEAGQLSHALLQYLPDLPRSRRSEAGQRFLDRRSVLVEPTEQATILDRALAILEMPALADLFGPGSRAEVPIVSEFSRPGEPVALFSGRIDRLAILSDCLAIADFKSGQPQVLPPPEYIAQLALYREALKPLYPDRPVRAYLVWLDGPKAIEIEPAALDEALTHR
jgi:ATP-dependent helicase/nuclease subunit A